MAYIIASDVASYLDVTFTDSETNRLNQIIPGLEAQIDRACNRSWVPTTPPAEPNPPLPGDVKLALIRWAADIFLQKPEAAKYGVSRLTQGPVTIEYDKTKAIGVDATGSTIPEYVKEVVALYRLHAI